MAIADGPLLKEKEAYMVDIITQRSPDEDAQDAARLAAKAAGTRLKGQLRWYSPHHREQLTTDGRTVKVYEPCVALPPGSFDRFRSF